jgi:hypothetical protein
MIRKCDIVAAEHTVLDDRLATIIVGRQWISASRELFGSVVIRYSGVRV